MTTRDEATGEGNAMASKDTERRLARFAALGEHSASRELARLRVRRGLVCGLYAGDCDGRDEHWSAVVHASGRTSSTWRAPDGYAHARWVADCAAVFAGFHMMGITARLSHSRRPFVGACASMTRTGLIANWMVRCCDSDEYVAARVPIYG